MTKHFKNKTHHIDQHNKIAHKLKNNFTVEVTNDWSKVTCKMCVMNKGNPGIQEIPVPVQVDKRVQVNVR